MGKDDSKTTSEATTLAETTTEAPKPTNVNLLSGIANLSQGAIGKRPVAVMINNIKNALPQYGISAADIIFEVVVEGGITRMMAIYGDYTKIPDVCSVRSCRYYFPIFASSFDAVYCCYGSNKSLGTETLERLNIDYFDGQYYGALYARDAERLKTYSREHTAYLKGSLVPSTLEKEDMRSDIKPEMKDGFFNFNERRVKIASQLCDKAVLNFSNSYYSTFTYDKESHTYLKQHNGNAHMDSVSGKQLAFTNVFILQTNVGSYEGSILRKVDWAGGTGYYMSMGTIKAITWSKANEMSPIVMKDSRGNIINVNPGKSYFGVLNPDEVEVNITSAQTATTTVG